MSDEILPEVEKIEKEVLRAREEGRKYWYGMSLYKEVKNQIEERFKQEDGYIVESKMCPRKLWDVIIVILPR
jgi:uncharacterized protein with PIN domain